MTHDEAIAAARADYQRVLGTIIEVNRINGMWNDDSCAWDCDPPVRVLVIDTPDGDVTYDVMGYIDPYWNVELLERGLKEDQRRDLLAHIPADARSFWVDGPSYKIEEG